MVDNLQIEKINESVCKVTSSDEGTLFTIKNYCSAKIPNARFLPEVKMGKSDGIKRFFKEQDNSLFIPKGIAHSLIKDYNLDITIDDIDSISRDEFNSFINSLNLPFTPYDFQLDTAFKCINSSMKISVLATGSGKSLVIYIICRWFLRKFKTSNKKILLIVPSIILLNQMYSDFKSYGFNNIDPYVDRLGSEFKIKKFTKPLNITTWQSLYRNTDLFEDIEVLIEDECHIAASNVHEYILYPSSINTKHKYGFTGTLPQNHCDKLTLVSVLGNAEVVVSPRKLIDMGLATDIQIKSVILHYTGKHLDIIKGIRNYNQELSYVLNIPERNVILAKLIKKVSEKGNTIVLFNRIESGELLAKLVCKLIYNIDIQNINTLRQINEYKIYFISGESKSYDRENIRQIMEKENNAIIFGTSSIISTGINIKKLKCLINTMPGKSYIKINQSIGRILRTHDSKNGIVYYYDIVDMAKPKYNSKDNYLFRHYKERLSFYNENEYVVDEINIQI